MKTKARKQRLVAARKMVHRGRKLRACKAKSALSSNFRLVCKTSGQRTRHDRMIEKFDRGEDILSYFDLDSGVMKTPI